MCNKYIQEFVSTSPIQHFDFLFFLFFYFIIIIIIIILFYFFKDKCTVEGRGKLREKDGLRNNNNNKVKLYFTILNYTSITLVTLNYQNT